MLLKKLSIFGFKSFADKTELHFGDGMTALIGPNGCGKSNVVDAIRWVLGEQKTSMLRSSNMNDVIFSGSEKRQPLNMAEVTITIENSDGILPLEYNEVAITRRIFRNGDSEYFINRTPSRLRDIQNLFLDTGIGTSGYTTIENSMINRILSDRADERRQLFEEAAGIGKYKQRIRESQKKLEKTKQDLLRINDRVQEKDRYVRILSRQVEKARRYQQYFDDLKRIELGYENSRFSALGKMLKERDQILAELETQLESKKAKIAEVESRDAILGIERTRKEQELQTSGKQVQECTERINSIEREISLSRQNLTFLNQNIARFEQEIVSLDQQSEEKSKLLTTLEVTVGDRHCQLESQTAKLAEAKMHLQEFDSRLSAHREKIQELNTHLLDVIQKIGDNQRDLTTSKTTLLHSLDRRDNDEVTRNGLDAHMEEIQAALNSSNAQLDEAREIYSHLLQSRQQLLSRIEQEDKRYHELVEKEKQFEAQIDSTKAQLRFLEGLDAAYEGYEAGVKALLKERMDGMVGILADLVHVETPLVPVVERALGSSIQTVVFTNDTAMLTAMEFLRTHKAGIASMISMESIGRMAASQTSVSDPLFNPLRHCVTAREGFDKLADYFFNPFVVCETTEQGLTLRQTIPSHSTLVCKDGAIFHGFGTVIAGSKNKEETGILQRKQEIERLKVALSQIRQSFETVVHDKEICIITRDEAKQALIEIDTKLNGNRKTQQEQETNIKHYNADLASSKERITEIEAQISKHDVVINECKNKIVVCESFLANIQQTRIDLNSQLESAKNKIEEMEEERKELSEHLRIIELSKHGLTNRMEQDASSILHLKADLAALASSRIKKVQETKNATEEIGKLGTSSQQLQEKLTNEIERRQTLQHNFETIRETYNGLLSEAEQLRKEIRVLSQEQELLANKKHASMLEQTRDEEQKRSIRERMYTVYEVDLQSPIEPIASLEKNVQEIEEEIPMLRERLKRVGEVNLGSVAEFERESTELKELVTQRDDLQKGVDDLEQAIRKLNREARSQFLSTFEKVQVNFRDMFTTLFEGGEASLCLEENDDPLEANIKIDVRPAGKKMQAISLLSGGERALTAISLLFALYLVKPSAYCILDELDAPLDDANIIRFVRILRKFSENTQFIIITHNKHTMEAADVMYGVTQQESGISTIASIRLHDAIQMKAA